MHLAWSSFLASRTSSSVALNLQLTPSSDLLVLLQGGSLRVADQSTIAGFLFRRWREHICDTHQQIQSDDIGSEFDASARCSRYDKAFVTNIGVGHFFPGEVMTSENHGAPLTYAYLGFTCTRFKVEH